MAETGPQGAHAARRTPATTQDIDLIARHVSNRRRDRVARIAAMPPSGNLQVSLTAAFLYSVRRGRISPQTTARHTPSGDCWSRHAVSQFNAVRRGNRTGFPFRTGGLKKDLAQRRQGRLRYISRRWRCVHSVADEGTIAINIGNSCWRPLLFPT